MSLLRSSLHGLVGLVLCAVAIVANGAVPSQFIAKMYTEALGRAPDSTGWQTYTNYFVQNGCSQSTLSFIAGGFFDSNEYKAKNYTTSETVLTLYRAVLSREPDPQGFATYKQLLQSGTTVGAAARLQAGGSEFQALIGAICSGGAYRQDIALTQAIDIGAGTWTQAQLTACLANTVCSLPQDVVVYLSTPVSIPAGHVLETAGQPSRLAYAKLARLVRNNANTGHLVQMGAGSTLRNVWIGGQRQLFKNYPTADGVRANVTYAVSEPTPGAIQNIRSDFPYQRSHIVTSGLSYVTIAGNLLVGYSGSHTYDGTWTWASDGISNGCPNASISSNEIVDPSDEGIVIFGATGIVQASTAFSNTVLHAGLSASGSFGFDTFNCTNGCTFTGAGIHDNLIMGGVTIHSDIMLTLGTGPWASPSNIPACPSSGNCGSGAHMNGNHTIWGDENQRIAVQKAIVVDGMLNADDLGNGLYVAPQNLGACYSGPIVISNDAPAHASGNLMAGETAPVHSCIGHP